MKRRDVLRRIERRAHALGVEVQVRELTRHTGLRVGNTSTTVPRHGEIADRLAEVIFKQLEKELGSRWWR